MPSHFSTLLQKYNTLSTDHPPSQWAFIAYDQLHPSLHSFTSSPHHTTGALFIENLWKPKRRPYHKQKLALLLSNMRHFALELARRNIPVHYEACGEPYSDALKRLQTQLQTTIIITEPAEYELRTDLETLRPLPNFTWQPHSAWLTTQRDFIDACGPQPPYRMDAFYRHVRRSTGILMDDRGKPLGGRFSLDGENRKPWNGSPQAPPPPTFPIDPVKREVCDLIESSFAHHPGTLTPKHLPATLQDANTLWTRAKELCMEHFGPYEDAMSTHSYTLFHTLLSPLINLHRLLPHTILHETLHLDIPLNSKEGFVRQLLGWREFVRHVHNTTRGFRSTHPTQPNPSDAQWNPWTPSSWPQNHTQPPHLDGGATPNELHANNPLPPTFWGTTSGLHCLDHAVQTVLKHGWSHHIERLMVLSNIATLLDLSPRQLSDWFHVAYIDAFDWVVEPNVLAMGTFATGDLMTTKPYVSGSAYIHKMSNFCASCSFKPKTTCPITHLYWAFLNRHQTHLAGNPRTKLQLASARRRSPEKQAQDHHIFQTTLDTLQRGQPLSPQTFKDTKTSSSTHN